MNNNFGGDVNLVGSKVSQTLDFGVEEAGPFGVHLSLK